MDYKENTLDYASYQERLKFNLLQRACWMAIIILCIVTGINIPTEGHNHWPEIAGISMAAIGLVLLWNSKQTYIVSKYISIATFVIINLTYFTRSSDLMYPVPLYMIMNILFAFYMLNRIWGITILALNFTGIIFFLILRYEDIITHAPEFNNQLILSIVIECIACGIGIGYLINLFIKSTDFAKNKLLLMNQELQKQNDEKTVMLKEIHHRVKNNMQIVSSLIRLQAITNNKNEGEYDDIIGRINAMALIHEKLYQSDMLTNFNLKSYLDSLSKRIMENYSLEKNIEFNMDIRIDKLSNRTVIPIALLFNELITNSVKYAFEETTSPCIDIEIFQTTPPEFEIIYSDNGHWKSNSQTGFGLELINTMTSQLDGNFQVFKEESGTTYKFKLTEIED